MYSGEGLEEKKRLGSEEGLEDEKVRMMRGVGIVWISVGGKS